MEKVFCLGFSKTGTTSIEEALKILGYNMYRGHFSTYVAHYLHALYVFGGIEEILKVTQYYDAFADAPFGGTKLYEHLVKKYPDATYVQTIRDPESWYQSFEAMFTKFDENLDTAFETFHENGRYSAVLFFQKIFNIDTLAGNKSKILDYYKSYNLEVERFFQNGNYRFGKLDIISGEGWPELCKILDRETPEMEFPHRNKGIYRDNDPPNVTKPAPSLRRRIKSKLHSLVDKL